MRLNLQGSSPDILQEAKIPIKHDSVKPNLYFPLLLSFSRSLRDSLSLLLSSPVKGYTSFKHFCQVFSALWAFKTKGASRWMLTAGSPDGTGTLPHHVSNTRARNCKGCHWHFPWEIPFSDPLGLNQGQAGQLDGVGHCH